MSETWAAQSCLVIGAAVVLASILPMPASAQSIEVRVIREAKVDKAGGLYVFNRPPLQPTAFVRLPVGAIRAKGWLRSQMELEAQGMIGRLEAISGFLKGPNGWIDPNSTAGWEEWTYWLKGYVDLGYAANDEKIIQHSRELIEAVLACQQADGWFGPAPLKGPGKGRPDTWPHSPALKALRSFHEVTGDPRVLKFMTAYCKWLNEQPGEIFKIGWGNFRVGDYLDSVYWLYNRTGDSWLLDLARKMHENSANYTRNVPTWHNVNLAQGFREPALYWLQTKDPNHLQGSVWVYDRVMGMYGQFPGGGFASDENCRPGYYDPRQGFEMCGIVEFMQSFEIMTRLTGNPLWTDRCEEIAFNTFPAALTPDLKALHYLTSPNQIQLDRKNKSPAVQNGGTMFSYSPGEVYRCCQHNHGMGWPYYAEELWLATADAGLCASLYAPCEVTAKVGDGTEVGIVEQTDYPFGDTIQLKVSTSKPVSFPLYLRVPRWCAKPEVAVNGSAVEVKAEPLSYIVVKRQWADGDTVTLRLPMQVAVRTWKKNKDSVSVDYGPLTYSLKIDEKWVRYGSSEAWPEWEVFPTSAWNYGLELDANDPGRSFQVELRKGPLNKQPFTPQDVPVSLRVKARKIPAWKMDDLGAVGLLRRSPARSSEPVETVTLIPMGAARLRIASFPTVGAGEGAYDWEKDESGFKASASFQKGDSLAALSDRIEPEGSKDHSIPRFTWWDHRGTMEWVQYDFPAPMAVASVEVYWYDDTGAGNCRPPASWRVLYKDGEDWKPVENASEYGTALDKYNRATFTAVKTSALRLEAQLKQGWSAGILEWRVK